jgi:quinol monooxygenase YgiN
MNPLTVIVTLQVRPGLEEEFLSLLTPVLDAMRDEPSFIDAALHRDPEDPSRFMLYETWADREDLVKVQMARPYRQTYEAALPRLLAAPRQAQVWNRLRRDPARW